MFGRRANLYLLTYLSDLCSTLFLFTGTRYLAEHDGDLMHLGILGVCGSLSYALSAAVVGHLCDRFGRRRLIALGSLTLAGANVAALQTMETPWIYLEYALSGVALSLIFPPLIALFSTDEDGGGSRGDRGRSSTRPLILFCLSWNLGVVSGNLTGGTVFAIDPQLCLKLGIGLCLVHFTLTLLNAHAVRRRQQTPVPVPSLDGTAELARETLEPPTQPVATMRLFAFTGWLGNMAAAFGISLVLYIFPQLAASLEIDAPTHGFMVMTSRFGVVSMYLLLHFTSFWRYRIEPGLVASACAIAGLWLLANATTVPLLTCGIVLVGILMGYNYFSSIFYSTTGFSDRRRGLAAGVHEAMIALGFTVGSLGGGYAGKMMGVRAPFEICIAAIVCISALQLIAFVALRRRGRAESSDGRWSEAT
jgi:MFS family permease